LNYILDDNTAVSELSDTFTIIVAEFTDDPVVTPVSVSGSWSVIFTVPDTTPANSAVDLVITDPA
jgi:hypothetical protein